MRALIQRVVRAEVRVQGEMVGSCGPGLLVFLGVARGDSKKEASWLVEKITSLRIFSDKLGKMNLSLSDISGSALVVSQFTLMADCQRGRRPGFEKAAHPLEAQTLYDYFVEHLATVIPVETGRFGADMEVFLVNDGPVTFLIERLPEESRLVKT